jgi:hypothetical protein
LSLFVSSTLSISLLSSSISHIYPLPEFRSKFSTKKYLRKKKNNLSIHELPKCNGIASLERLAVHPEDTLSQTNIMGCNKMLFESLFQRSGTLLYRLREIKSVNALCYDICILKRRLVFMLKRNQIYLCEHETKTSNISERMIAN